MPGSGFVADPGLAACHAPQWRDHDRDGLGLPPRVDDRTTIAADVLAVSEDLPAPPVLVGASLGGLAALVAVARSGDPVPALVLPVAPG